MLHTVPLPASTSLAASREDREHLSLRVTPLRGCVGWFAGDGASKGCARKDQAFGGWVGKSTSQEGVEDAATQRPDVRPLIVGTSN